MEESVPPPSSSERLQQVSEESSPVPLLTTPTIETSAKPPPGEMEFAQMPLHHHYGPYGNPATMFDMSDLSGSLPHYSHTQFPPHVTQAGAIHPNLAYSAIPNQQWVSQVANQYAQQFASTSQPTFPGYDMNMANANMGMHARGQMVPQQQVPYSINLVPQPHYQNYQTQHNPYTSPQMPYYESRSHMPYPVGRPPPEFHGLQSNPSIRDNADSRRDSSNSTLQISTTLRGPPRKAKQSGHALWVGNLPPGTNILDLKDHLSRDATDEIQSVFLIAKTNCAFVNYKTAESCTAAMMRFHDSRFRQMRLVCRLRRGSGPNSAVEHGQSEYKESVQSPSLTPTSGDPRQAPQNEGPPLVGPSRTAERLVKEKFFIIKSLTREDVDRAVASGTWATQAQNEENLNLAYETAENVYLIFSVNKSSEYYGYARMDSAITGDRLMLQETVQQPTVSPNADDGPTIIPTPATATAPRGYIVDDSARGNIFWEAEIDASTSSASSTGTSTIVGENSGDEAASEPSAQPSNVGRPFKISWRSTEKLPFIRTRGLRNPWNSNREIKIARDGTEVEPTVGRRLISMFEQQGHMNTRQTGMAVPSQLSSHVIYPSMMPHGYAYNVTNLNGPTYGRPY